MPTPKKGPRLGGSPAHQRLIVANQSFFTGTTSNQAILDVYVGERGAPEAIPHRAGRG